MLVRNAFGFAIQKGLYIGRMKQRAGERRNDRASVYAVENSAAFILLMLNVDSANRGRTRFLALIVSALIGDIHVQNVGMGLPCMRPWGPQEEYVKPLRREYGFT